MIGSRVFSQIDFGGSFPSLPHAGKFFALEGVYGRVKDFTENDFLRFFKNFRLQLKALAIIYNNLN